MAAAWKRTWFLIAATSLAACKSAATEDREIPEAPPSASRYASADTTARDSALLEPSLAELEAAAPARSASRVHVVKPGDTLFALARLYYHGDMSKWHAIYDANRDRVPNKDRLRVGQELVIPD
jgi:nucleoid-associated protein YgaU